MIFQKSIQISSFKKTCHFHFLPCATGNMILWGTFITLFILCNKNILYSYKPKLVLDSLILYIDVCIVLMHQLTWHNVMFFIWMLNIKCKTVLVLLLCLTCGRWLDMDVVFFFKHLNFLSAVKKIHINLDDYIRNTYVLIFIFQIIWIFSCLILFTYNLVLIGFKSNFNRIIYWYK